MKTHILITGGAGFIGSHVIREMVNKYPEYQIYNFDKLTYAGNLENLEDVKGKDNYHFIKGDIEDPEQVNMIFERYPITGVIHLAAESHVDRSIKDPLAFLRTNIMGTVNLLQAAKKAWEHDGNGKRFYHISTDEVYGSLGDEGLFTEETSYDPKSPYSASKASSDHFVRAYYNTYKLPIVISNCSNNYGPNQFPEKLIPLVFNNILQKKEIPVYGKGENIRDWLYVVDHAKAIDLIFHQGTIGETYNIGGENEWKNIELVRLMCQTMDKRLDRREGESESLIRFVTDRAGHDLRYAIDSSKIRSELGWCPLTSFEEGIVKTINWYLDNPEWLNRIVTGAYADYYQNQYQ